MAESTPLPVILAGDDDASMRLREVAFGALVADPAPVEAARLVDASGLDRATVDAALGRLADAGRIDRDPSGRVLGAAGLTIADGPHGLTLGGHAYRTWCALDAIGIPAALGADARVETACAVCGRALSVEISGGRPQAGDAARLWLSAGGANMRLDFCTPTVLLCSDAHAREWGERHGGHGEVIDLDATARHGEGLWRSAADTALAMGAATHLGTAR